VGGLSHSEIRAVLTDWSFWRHAAQSPPEDDWRIWLFMGGRGAGKTRAGAEWVAEQVRAGKRRIALIAPTLGDAREVMIEGPSGLARIGKPSEQPNYEVSRRRLVWPCGALGYVFSAEDPDSLRGPQFDCAWADEFAAWALPQATLDNLRLGLRLGDNPQLAITTTPRPIPALKHILTLPGVAVSRAGTDSNSVNLAPGFMESVAAVYGGSRLGRQELDGELIEDPPGALWTRTQIESALTEPGEDFDRIVVAVDPPASAHGDSDECGIVVVGASGHGPGRCATVLADRSFGPASPEAWARLVAESFEAFEADRVVAEANQGGDMVASVLKAAHASLPVTLVRASRGKHTRAEPVAALYAAGRVKHAGRFPALEDQMCAFGAPENRAGSPDRVDALVWAISALLLGPDHMPRLRRL
tara:strand:- start:3679 stop:4926 length:1248 start_codon:yes stop_codon:yes gene_type:complete